MNLKEWVICIFKKTRHINKFINQIVTIILITDYLKFNEKIGL